MVFEFGLRRLVTAIALILAVCGCASERVMEKAQGEAEYFPVGSVPIQVTGASRDARYLYVCVVATNPDGWRHSYTIKTDASGANLAPRLIWRLVMSCQWSKLTACFPVAISRRPRSR